MSATKPANLSVSLQKATEGFMAIIDCSTDIIEIRQQLLTFIIKTKYDQLTLTHNISGVILPSERYKNIYKKGDYLIPPVITLYDGTIDSDATRTEVNQAEGKQKSKQNERQIY